MNILVVRTNIKSRKKLKSIKHIFNEHPVIRRWSIDTEDIDNVLRIESRGQLKEQDVIKIIRSTGFYAEVLA